MTCSIRSLEIEHAQLDMLEIENAHEQYRDVAVCPTRTLEIAYVQLDN